MKEEKEEWEIEKDAGIAEWASGMRLFGVEKRGKEMMAGSGMVKEKLARERELWEERKSGWLASAWIRQAEEKMVHDEWCSAERNAQPLRGSMTRSLTHNEVLTIFTFVRAQLTRSPGENMTFAAPMPFLL
ncbi:uncharacterized protein MONOS_11792 [Monocercomonoides exilis]|uniref:uncharacterized protein n=1 Tax=Monocercomonoides exilis TaxID=2049356 RepID=UPI00355A2BDD|nr:hypothetical protein MONOS_11792 [Monocercomonoides exilis]|eukprot:MONOS_11792.1-p1 / transcript=MONOS_11792.1 / gene=MONOS_11792 / organism=Monocercomonoides_exilis_PA203 / gene_product=unspecified product / transcript_product=unspecified product / location=Mono_scaffold00611:34050-34442(+) / protein_length=131 / sequence_SO=supercontig / SO=protein_coding / is_pseudo=false